MKKKIKDITFEEFANWANLRACDGKWCFDDAVNSSELCVRVYSETNHHIFGKKKARERLFKKIYQEYLNPEAEIDPNI